MDEKNDYNSIPMQPTQTAMQELLEHLNNEWSSPSDCWNPSKVIDKVESMIEKEKDQIINAYESYPALIMSAEEYYNQTYHLKSAVK